AATTGPQMVQEAGQELESKERQQEQARRLEGIETAQPRHFAAVLVQGSPVITARLGCLYALQPAGLLLLAL
ncbi:hypothetical protein, partial [Aeromonas caviae]